MLVDKFIHLFPTIRDADINMRNILKFKYLKAGVYVMQDWITQSKNVANEASYREHNSLKQYKDLGKFSSNRPDSWISSMRRYIDELRNVGNVAITDLAGLTNELNAIAAEIRSL